MERKKYEIMMHRVWQYPFEVKQKDAFEAGVGEDGKTRISIDMPEGCSMEIYTVIQPDGSVTLQMETDAPAQNMMHELLCNAMILNMEE